MTEKQGTEPRCPKCSSTDFDCELEYHGPGVDGFSCECRNCGHEWSEHFEASSEEDTTVVFKKL